MFVNTGTSLLTATLYIPCQALVHRETPKNRSYNCSKPPWPHRFLPPSPWVYVGYKDSCPFLHRDRFLWSSMLNKFTRSDPLDVSSERTSLCNVPRPPRKSCRIPRFGRLTMFLVYNRQVWLQQEHPISSTPMNIGIRGLQQRRKE